MNFPFSKAVQAFLIRINKPKVYHLIDKIIRLNLSYLVGAALYDLSEAVRLTKNTPGMIVEAGTALGGSAILISSVKNTNKELLLFDTFTQIPAPTVKDGPEVMDRYETIVRGEAKGIGADKYYGYQPDLVDVVKKNFDAFGIDLEKNNIKLIKGLYQETMFITSPVSMAHIDCDWYESVKYCLEQISPNLQVGGIIVIDDYDHWSGCRVAVDEFLGKQENSGAFKVVHKSRLQLRRIR